MKRKKINLTANHISMHILPRCKTCNQLFIPTCDRSKPSELVEWLGTEWLITKPEKMWMFPTLNKQEQSEYCPYCQDKLYPALAGKES